MVAPWASPSPRGKASAWIETNSAADSLRAIFTRSPSGMKVSSVAGHDDAILARFLDPIAQRQAKSQHQILFHDVAAAGLGAVVDAAMAGIDHDHRPLIRRPGCRLRRGWRIRRRSGGVGLGDRGPQFGAVFGRQRLDKGGAVDLLEFEHQPRRLAVGRLQHIGFGDLGRSGQVEHDPRSARHDETIAERLDQSPPCDADSGRKLETDLGKIDDHPIGVGQRQRRETGSALSRSRMKRVCLASPARRASDAIGKFVPPPGGMRRPRRRLMAGCLSRRWRRSTRCTAMLRRTIDRIPAKQGDLRGSPTNSVPPEEPSLPH